MDLEQIARSPLFQGMDPARLEETLAWLGAEERAYEKGAVVCRVGETVEALGLVLSGRIGIENDDVWGNKSVLSSVGPGAVFAETYACLPGEPLMVSAVAAEASVVLLLKVSRLFRPGGGDCPHKERLLRNLLAVSARKNLELSRRIFHTSAKTIRGRLLSYLSYQAVRAGSRTFTIPFHRQQLADYLGVDRSALSAELGKMGREGLLETRRSRFTLKTELME